MGVVYSDIRKVWMDPMDLDCGGSAIGECTITNWCVWFWNTVQISERNGIVVLRRARVIHNVTIIPFAYEPWTTTGFVLSTRNLSYTNLAHTFCVDFE